MKKLQRVLVMTVLCMSGGIIFILPFLREVYYVPMQEAFGYTNTEMGILVSVFGAVSLVSYFPGGWLADRFSPRKLIASGLLGMGLGGIYFSGFPGFTESVILHGFWGLCGAFVFWGAMIKATRDWGGATEQGKAFGTLEGGRGITEGLSSTLFLAVFAWLGSSAESLAQIILLFAAVNLLLAAAAWLILPDTVGGDMSGTEAGGHLKDVAAVLKMPVVWLISMVVLAAYSAAWGTYYFAPYATEVYGLSVVAGGVVGVAKMWLKPFAAVSAGFFADRIGVSTTVLGFFIVNMACFAVLSILPAGPAFLAVMLINAALISVAVFALRGVYFALLEEGGVAPAVTGTAVGVVSALGFTPDVFMPLVGGVLLDAYPGAQGYRYFYAVIAIFCVVGATAAWLIRRDYSTRYKLATR